MIINPGTGLALDVKWGNTANKTGVHTWGVNKSGAQQWKLERSKKAGYYFFFNP